MKNISSLLNEQENNNKPVFKTIKVVSNTHLTQGNKNSILAILNQCLMQGKVGRTNYFLTKTDNDNEYDVKINIVDRGMGWIGNEKRLSEYKHKIIVK